MTAPARVSAPNQNHWSDDELAQLVAAYGNAKTGHEIGLAALCLKIGRSKPNVSRKARLLGLANIARPKLHVCKPSRRKFKTEAELRANQSAAAKERIARNGHPRGILDHQLSDNKITPPWRLAAPLVRQLRPQTDGRNAA